MLARELCRTGPDGALAVIPVMNLDFNVVAIKKSPFSWTKRLTVKSVWLSALRWLLCLGSVSLRQLSGGCTFHHDETTCLVIQYHEEPTRVSRLSVLRECLRADETLRTYTQYVDQGKFNYCTSVAPSNTGTCNAYKTILTGLLYCEKQTM